MADSRPQHPTLGSTFGHFSKMCLHVVDFHLGLFKYMFHLLTCFWHFLESVGYFFGFLKRNQGIQENIELRDKSWKKACKNIRTSDQIIMFSLKISLFVFLGQMFF